MCEVVGQWAGKGLVKEWGSVAPSPNVQVHDKTRVESMCVNWTVSGAAPDSGEPTKFAPGIEVGVEVGVHVGVGPEGVGVRVGVAVGVRVAVGGLAAGAESAGWVPSRNTVGRRLNAAMTTANFKNNLEKELDMLDLLLYAGQLQPNRSQRLAVSGLVYEVLEVEV